jgi:hypothetical protein
LHGDKGGFLRAREDLLFLRDLRHEEHPLTIGEAELGHQGLLDISLGLVVNEHDARENAVFIAVTAGIYTGGIGVDFLREKSYEDEMRESMESIGGTLKKVELHQARPWDLATPFYHVYAWFHGGKQGADAAIRRNAEETNRRWEAEGTQMRITFDE